MNDHDVDDVFCQMRESFSGLRMDTRLETLLARSRARRARRLLGLTAAGAAAAAAAVTMAAGGPAPARSVDSPSASQGTASQRPASQRPVVLAAFTVTSGPGGSTTLILRKGARLDPAALRDELARHGIPALVTVGTFCRAASGDLGGVARVLHPATLADGSDAMVINGRALPSGTRLSIGYFAGHARLAIIKDGAALSCGATAQPAAHVPPSGPPIRR